MMQIAVVVLTLLAATRSVEANCSDHHDCRSCAESTETVVTWFASHDLKCNWCPLSQSCHVEYSWYNDCESYQEVDNSSYCPEVADPTLHYDSHLAANLAKWSSLAYVDPSKRDKTSIQKAVDKHIEGSYEVVEFITADCDWIFQFGFCGVVIGKSLKENRIVVAFEGTSSTHQLREQLATSLVRGLKEFEPIGGKVLDYNFKTHERLYPCVKSLVQEILSTLPTAEVIVTGHSLGGAQSQLTGAHLLSDGVVPQSRLQVYTFGSPRVGDIDFAFGYDRLLGNSWRVTKKDDPIPLIISPFLCYHTRREVYYNASGIMNATTPYKICLSNEDESGCTKDEGICLARSCFTDVHQQYFLENLPSYMAQFIAKGVTKYQGKRGKCRAYTYDM